MQTVTKDIFLEPSELNGNLLENIYKKAVKTLENVCDGTYGFIRKIQNDIKIKKNIVSSTTPGIYFTIQFKAECSKPEKGSTYDGKISDIKAPHVFVKIFDEILVYIPKTKLKYDFKGNTLVKTDKKKEKILSVGDKVRVKIEDFEYTKKKFNCIGTLE